MFQLLTALPYLRVLLVKNDSHDRKEIPKNWQQKPRSGDEKATPVVGSAQTDKKR